VTTTCFISARLPRKQEAMVCLPIELPSQHGYWKRDPVSGFRNTRIRAGMVVRPVGWAGRAARQPILEPSHPCVRHLSICRLPGPNAPQRPREARRKGPRRDRDHHLQRHPITVAQSCHRPSTARRSARGRIDSSANQTQDKAIAIRPTSSARTEATPQHDEAPATEARSRGLRVPIGLC